MVARARQTRLVMLGDEHIGTSWQHPSGEGGHSVNATACAGAPAPPVECIVEELVVVVAVKGGRGQDSFFQEDETLVGLIERVALQRARRDPSMHPARVERAAMRCYTIDVTCRPQNHSSGAIVRGQFSAAALQQADELSGIPSAAELVADRGARKRLKQVAPSHQRVHALSIAHAPAPLGQCLPALPFRVGVTLHLKERPAEVGPGDRVLRLSAQNCPCGPQYGSIVLRTACLCAALQLLDKGDGRSLFGICRPRRHCREETR
eukprot:3585526-Prymnesium_polylepis.1